MRTSNAATGPRSRVEVSDTGIGHRARTPAEDLRRVRAGRSRDATRTSGGLGLGLAIARALVDAHGGTIEAQSRGPGRGETFIVELPTAAAIESSRAPLTKVSPAARGEKASNVANGDRLPILVVEDHVDSGGCSSAARLRRLRPQVAENVGDAIHTGRQKRFGLLLSDLALPDGTGIDVLRALREGGPNVDIPAIALTGHGMPDDIGNTEAAGFCDHLTKPIDMERLQAAIIRATGHNGRDSL